MRPQGADPYPLIGDPALGLLAIGLGPDLAPRVQRFDFVIAIDDRKMVDRDQIPLVVEDR